MLQLPRRRSRLEKATEQQSRRARPAMATTRKRSFRRLRAAVALPLRRALLLLSSL